MTPPIRDRLKLIYFCILLKCTCHQVTASTLHQRAVSRYIIKPSQSVAISNMRLLIPCQLINGGVMRTLFRRCLGKHYTGLNRGTSRHYHGVVIKLLMATSRHGRPVKAVIHALDLFHALFHHATALCGVDESHAALLSRLFMPLPSHYAALIESELLQSHNVASRNL
jgi:hypothetical protein